MKKDNVNQKAHINNNLLKCLLVLVAITIVVFVVNIAKVATKDAGQGTTIANSNTENTLKNDSYSIGNNPTEINKTYFKELNSAVSNNSAEDISQSVVKCFITEYYTWTNKDGNYDIGGMQYMFTPKKSDFAEYTLWNFYVDMDLYITKYGNSNLMQVKDVTINSVKDGGNYTVQLPGDESEVTTADSAQATNEDLPSYTVDASWTYEDNTSIQTSQFQNHAVFHVVNNNGRWEIAGIDAA